MIPRTVRRLESTLLSYSRQRLPRPARYSTPSRRVNAPAVAHAFAPVEDLPAFMVSSPSTSRQVGDDVTSHENDMESFLRRTQPLTIIPPPRPDEKDVAAHFEHYIDTSTQDQLAVIQACLHSLHDVPRAKEMFERLRSSRHGDPVLETKLYNSFLHAYLRMASEKDASNRKMWVEDLWSLYQIMETGYERVEPNEGTYAIVLLAWHKFNPQSENPVLRVNMATPRRLIRDIIDRELSFDRILADLSFTTSEEASAVLQVLSRTAADDPHMSAVVTQLGEAATLASTLKQAPTGAEEVLPEIAPVTKTKVIPGEVRMEVDENGNEVQVVAPDTVDTEIPFNLDNLRNHLAKVVLARRVLPEDVAARQRLLEESVWNTAKARFEHETKMMEQLDLGPRGLNSGSLQKWMWEWHQKLQKKLRDDIPAIIEEESGRTGKRAIKDATSRLSPFLVLLKPEKLSLITILELMRLQGSGGVSEGMKTARALVQVGKAIENEYKAEMCKRNKIPIPHNPAEPQGKGYFSRSGYKDLHQRRVVAAKYMDDSEEWMADWSQNLRIKFGSFLVDSLMSVATVTVTAKNKKTMEEVSQDQPAFFHSYEYQKGHKLGVIKLNSVVSERLAKDPVNDTFHPRHLPMLIKPKPWLTPTEGGYLYNKSEAMRFKDSVEQATYLRQASAQGNLELVYAGMDVLGSTPWAVNRKVFDVIAEVWNSGERMGKMPPAVYDGAKPEKPQNYNDDQHARSVYIQRERVYNQSKAANHSDRCSVNYKIEIARAFLHDTFYFPHNLDFRGRAYPMPPHLNHVGDDLSRGLLMFGEKRALGERGLRWLKIHLANLAGFDKGSFDERVNWVHNHMDEIYDSALNPLEGKRWWLKADDPWQCLATCFELHAALESGDPHNYESALPVHQDGTCNGLQHYAALGGDSQGAKQVNLAVTDRPSDVYTYVADMVEAQIALDIEKTDNKYAHMLKGRIARKVVKQTVMTTVYGVTFIGAREQIHRQLEARGEIPSEECWGASSYLAKKVLFCIGDLFRGAKHIQTWLNLVARLISKSIPPDRLPEAVRTGPKSGEDKGKRALVGAAKIKKEQMTSVIWTTPLGLPIVQPYRKIKRRQIMTSLQTVFISDPNSPAGVNSAKQASAFPPNFIHSLDATHMMLTALECRTKGLTFASVHDSYWTHASSIDDMSAIIRDTFIALHSSDVLKRLREEFTERYKGFKVPVVTMKAGNLQQRIATYTNAVVADKEQMDQLKGITSELTVDLKKSSGITEEDEAAEEDVEDGLAPSKKTSADSEELSAEPTQVSAKFVELADLLPPLPEKGDFDVNTIKQSAYFFS